MSTSTPEQRPSFDVEKMRERIVDRLAELRMTQKDLEKAAGLGKGHATNILKRGQMPSVDKLDAISRALEVSIGYLMYGVDLPEDFADVFELMQKNPKKFRALLALLE